MNSATFNAYALSDELRKSLEILNYKSPTPVQSQVIPAVLEKKDVIVKSRTGSGKTAAFAIPICQLIDWDENKPQALVITPTRELALQVKEDIFNIGRYKRLNVPVVFGKSPFHKQEKELKQRTHVVVGTPGRLIDHLDRKTLDLSNVKYLVVDEADEMLKMGFVDQVEEIVKQLPKDRVTVMLSATMPEDIQRLCSKYMRSPLQVEVAEQSSTATFIVQERYEVNPAEKLSLLKDLVTIENPDSCMIFCNTQVMVDTVCEAMVRQLDQCEKIHGGMEQDQRTQVMSDFRKGRFRYLVATDVAARGIDIDGISLVVNYDVPNTHENYVHRIGRTGRIGNRGKAMTFVSTHENKLLADLHNYLGREIPYKERPTRAQVAEAQQDFNEKISAAPEFKETKSEKLNKNIMKLHINAGKKTKMRRVDIVGTLCNLEGVVAEDIGIISIAEISTFVEILNDKGEQVLNALQDKPIKGRLRKVSRADK